MSTPPSLSGRVQDRHRRKRRLRVRVVLIVAAVLVLLGGLGWLVGFSPVFGVRETAVEGTSLLAPQDVIDAAQIEPATPLVFVDPEQVARRVVELPEVAQVTVTRELPGTVRLQITERQPVLLVGEGDDQRMVAADGTSFAHRDVEGLSLPTADVTVEDPRLLADVAAVAGALTPELSERVRQISASSRDDIALELDGDPEIFFGSADQAELKAQVATALLDQDVSSINVSSPGNPATTP